MLHPRPAADACSNESAGRWCGAVGRLQDPDRVPRIRCAPPPAPWCPIPGRLLEVMAGGLRGDGRLPPVRTWPDDRSPPPRRTSRTGWSSPIKTHRTTRPRPPHSVAPDRPRPSTGEAMCSTAAPGGHRGGLVSEVAVPGRTAHEGKPASHHATSVPSPPHPPEGAGTLGRYPCGLDQRRLRIRGDGQWYFAFFADAVTDPHWSSGIKEIRRQAELAGIDAQSTANRLPMARRTRPDPRPTPVRCDATSRGPILVSTRVYVTNGNKHPRVRLSHRPDDRVWLIVFR
jgi:hypothetical protein